MQYRLFEAQMTWQAQYATAIPPTPSGPTVFRSIQLNQTNPGLAFASSSYNGDSSIPTLRQLETSRQRLRPRLAPLANRSSKKHCRTISILSEGDTTASSPSSEASVLATPSFEATQSSWDASSPSRQGDYGASLSPFPFLDSCEASSISSSGAFIVEQCTQSVATIGSKLCNSNAPDEDVAGISPRHILRHRAPSKESPKRIIQNREKSKRYYYRRKAQRDASKVLLDPRATLTEPSHPASELDKSQMQSQLSEIDSILSPFVDVACAPSLGTAACYIQVSEQHMPSKNEATLMASQVDNSMLSTMVNSGANVSRQTTKIDPGFLQAMWDGMSSSYSNWQDLLAVERPSATVETLQ